MEHEKYFISISDESCNFICVGYVSDFLVAQRIVQANSGSILNNAKYAIIEKVKEGLFMYDISPWICQVVRDKEGNVEGAKRIIDLPSELLCKQGHYGFGISLAR